MRLNAIPVVLLASLLAAGCSHEKKTEPEKSTPAGRTLCERVGGYDEIKKVTQDFVENYVVKDDRIKGSFAHADLAHLERELSEQIGEAAGCPGVTYKGKSMRSAHAGMGITNEQFNAFIEDFSKCLDKNGIAAPERDELVGKLTPTKTDIVEKTDRP
jgi:hemoglobin